MYICAYKNTFTSVLTYISVHNYNLNCEDCCMVTCHVYVKYMQTTCRHYLVKSLTTRKHTPTQTRT